MLKKVVAQLDKVALSLHKRGLGNHASVLCKLRDVVASEAEMGPVPAAPKLSAHAAKLDALARKAHEDGLGDIAAELCAVRDSVQAEAIDAPDGFQPVNTGEEGYPEDAQSEAAVPKDGEVTTGPQNAG